MEDKMLDNNNFSDTSKSDDNKSLDFIRAIVAEDIKNNKNSGRVHTRFPPEPNGFLHIGHAKAICLDFGIAQENKGVCNLRFDDTNPAKEEVEYIEAIKEDIKWLGFDWENREYYASDYFDKLYEYAVQLVKTGKAYVDDLSPQEIREYRGTLTEPGKNSPYRNRSIEENLDLFDRMKNGEFEDGSRVLRAKIDMAHPNLNMRDPTIYRIKRVSHHRTKDKWCIYPMYDFTHCLSDSIEGITHSFCTLEFEDHRLLYDWFLDELEVKCHPQQIEFARLNLTYTVMSKRKLLELVEEGYVSGWNDPRMPTISGLRRRGYTPQSIRSFCERIGISKVISTIDIALLEYFIREELNKTAQRVMAVLRPLLVVIENYPEDKVEWIDAINNPEDESTGTRKIPFAREIYIESEDFMEIPPKGYHRLSLGTEVRLKHAYYIKCVGVVKDEKTGEILELRCTYDPKSRGGWTDDGRKVKGTSHWVTKAHAVPAEIRLYNHLFLSENPLDTQGDGDWKDNINPESVELLSSSLVEPGLEKAKPGDSFQFLRQGYFSVDIDTTKDKLVFNRTVSLKDSWAKIARKL